MIEDSVPWKKELLKIAAKLESRYNQKRWSQQSFFALEKELFLGFFSARKLFESNKISRTVETTRFELAAYPVGEKEVTLMNQHRFPELYDLYAGLTEELTIRDLANQFVHSAILSPFVPSGQSLVGVFIASDRAKKKMLFYVPLNKIIGALRSVANDNPTKYEAHFDDEKKEYVVVLSTETT